MVKEHDRRLESVLKRARKINLKLNADKSRVCQRQVSYEDHLLMPEGIRSDPSRVQSIVDLPVLSDKAGLQRFLSMIGYVQKFIPNMLEIAQPLLTLLLK